MNAKPAASVSAFPPFVSDHMPVTTRWPNPRAMLALSIGILLAGLAGCSSGGGGGNVPVTLQITTTTLPNGITTVAYNATISATAGFGPYTWTYTGTLPSGLSLDTASTTETTTLTGLPNATGTFNFTVTVTGASGTDTDDQPFTVIVGTSTIPPGTSVTTVTVTNPVVQAGVKRLGINIGGRSRWSAAQILKNMIDNPSFEAGVVGTVFLAATGSTSATFTPDFWDTSSGNLPIGYWDGAPWEIVFGPAKGQSGTVTSFTYSGGDYAFDLGGAGTAMNQYDVLFVRRTVPGLSGNTFQGDTSQFHSGAQSRRLEQPPPSGGDDRFDWVMDTSWRDGDQTSHKMLVVEGDWRFRFWARGQAGGEQVRVTFRRDGGPPHNPTFFQQTYNLTNAWQQFDTGNVNVPTGTDELTDPWPVGYRPAAVLSVELLGSPAVAWIDDLDLHSVDNSTNPTVFTDLFVDQLISLNPGILRDWSGQLGETLDNQLAATFDRGTVSYKPSSPNPGGWNYGLHDFLELCDHVGAEPWYVCAPTFTAADWMNLCEYLAAPSTAGPYAALRAAQGQTAPWTSVFPRIHLEFGNELWGGADPGDPFGGASVRGGLRLGEVGSDRLGLLKTSPHYAGVSSVINLIIGGQAGYAGRQQEIETAAGAVGAEHDTVALAPYFGVLNDWATPAEIYGPLFAGPFYHAGAGNMGQSKTHLINGGNGTELAIYEINFHTTSTSYTIPNAGRNDYVTGMGGIALALSMLVYQTQLAAIDQCAFSSLGYSYRYNTTEYVRIWGMLRDLYQSGRRRPTWLGVDVANRAIMGDAVTSTRTGDNPNWTQAALNEVGAPTTVDRIQSFAYRNGNQYAIVLFNLDLTTQHGVRLVAPGSPSTTATEHLLDSGSISDDNEDATTITIQTNPITTFGQNHEMVLPPFSMRVITWSN